MGAVAIALVRSQEGGTLHDVGMERRVWNQQPSRRERQQQQKPSEVAARKI